MRLSVYNPRGSTAKTTTALTLAWVFARMGKRTLLIDTDPFGSRVASLLNLTPNAFLFDLLVDHIGLSYCTSEIRERLHIVCSDQRSALLEDRLASLRLPQVVLEHAMKGSAERYDAIIIDVCSPITWLQTAAVAFTEHVLVPLTLDVVGFQGAFASIGQLEAVRRVLCSDVDLLGWIPVMADMRRDSAESVAANLKSFSASIVFPLVRADQAVAAAERSHKFIGEVAPQSAVLADYVAVATAVHDDLLK